MSQMKQTTRMNIFAGKSAEIVYQENKLPTAPDDFDDKCKASSGTATDLANTWQIDVLPNFIPIICRLMYYSNLHYGQLEATKHAKISEATLCLYFLTIIYAHWLISDLAFRSTPSSSAYDFDFVNYKREFLEFVVLLPVPTFIERILRRLTHMTTSHRSNVQWTPTFAGYSFHHHFGRIVPLTFFTTIHDVICDLPGNIPPTQALYELLTRPIVSITDVSTNRGDIDFTIAHYTSQAIEINTRSSFFNSRINQFFTTLFNPSLMRDYHRRQHLAPLNIIPQTYATDHNPYDFIFCASRANFGELRLVLSNLAPIIQEKISCSGNLAKIYESPSASKIIVHGYSKYALPTWHAHNIKIERDTKQHLVTSQQYASAIKFLNTPQPTYQVDQTYPTAVCQVDNTHPIDQNGFDWPWILMFDEPRQNRQSPDPQRDFEIYNEDKHLAPTVWVLDPIEVSTPDAYLVSALGMTIESLELDGTVLGIPNTEQPLGMENSQFADSAIALRYIHRATRYFSNNPRTSANPRSRIIERSTRFAAASHLIDRTKVFVPRPMQQTEDDLIMNNFPGLTIAERVTWFTKFLSFIGHRTADLRTHGDSSDKAPGVQEGRIILYSPYTYVGYFGEDSVDTAHADDKIYFLSNLRTIFGTDYPLIKTNNAYDFLPIF